MTSCNLVEKADTHDKQNKKNSSNSNEIIYEFFLNEVLRLDLFSIDEEPSTTNPIYDRIDFRFEDEMVDPRVECEERGMFAHPRNCTWFYV